MYTEIRIEDTIKDDSTNQNIPTPEKVDQFLSELGHLYLKYNLSIGFENKAGGSFFLSNDNAANRLAMINTAILSDLINQPSTIDYDYVHESTFSDKDQD